MACFFHHFILTIGTVLLLLMMMRHGEHAVSIGIVTAQGLETAPFNVQNGNFRKYLITSSDQARKPSPVSSSISNTTPSSNSNRQLKEHHSTPDSNYNLFFDPAPDPEANKAGAVWHAYDPVIYNKRKNIANSTPSDCMSFEQATEPYSPKFIAKYKLWPNLQSSYDIDEGEAVYGSHYGIKTIYDHQHPAEDCKNLKFIISLGHPNGGFGSQLHVESVGLTIALDTNRIFVSMPNEQGIRFDHFPFCTQRNVKGYNCYWEPWSKCNLADALSHVNGDMKALKKYKLTELVNPDNKNYTRNYEEMVQHKTILLEAEFDYWVFHVVPKKLAHLIDCAPLVPRHKIYWWRAVASAYFFRPNVDSLAMINKYDTIPFAKNIMGKRNTIGIYIRKGYEKSGEMKFILTKDYLNVTDYMWRSGMLPSYFDDKPDRTIFIGTEDPGVIRDVEEYGAKYGWRVQYTNLYDRSTQVAFSGKGVTDDLTFVNMMLTIQYFCQTESWVSTLTSNFIRVFDELRATVGGKANRFFADISHETCTKPPCIGSEFIVQFPY